MTQPLNKRRVIVFIFEVCYYEVIEIEVLNPILKKTKRKVLNLSSLRDEKLSDRKILNFVRFIKDTSGSR